MDREWPDWRNVDPSRAIEHIKSNSGNPRHDHLHRVSDTGQIPMCEECDEEMNGFEDRSTGVSGWSCDICGWSYDNEL